MTENAERFVIPKKKKRTISPEGDKIKEKSVVRLRPPMSEESETLTENILSTLSQRMLRRYLDIQNIQIVENSLLAEKFQKMKNSIRFTTYRIETLSFILIGSNDEELSKIINFGLSVDYSLFSDLGSSKQGVTVYRFVDQVTPAPFFPGINLRILCFKTLRGKSMNVDLGSSSLSPSPIYNSHIVTTTHDQRQNLTTLEKFRISGVYHFEFDANGHPMKIPSGVLPYAVFDLVPNYGDKKLPSYATRLWPRHRLTMNASIIPSAGVFAGSLCKLMTIRGDGANPCILNFSLLHVQNQFYKWKALLKMKLFVSLMKQDNWSKLLKVQEFGVKVHDDAKSFVSYWIFKSFQNNATEGQQLLTKMESQYLGLIGNCGDTTLFLFPNGQMASLLGLPSLHKSTMHCISVNAKLSMLGILPQDVQINRFESNMASPYSNDVANNVSVPKLDKNESSNYDENENEEAVRSVSWDNKQKTHDPPPLCLPNNGKMLLKYVEMNSTGEDECLSINQQDDELFYESEDAFFADEFHTSGQTLTAKSGKPKGEICENNSILIKDVNDECLSINQQDDELFYESEDAFFADEFHTSGQTLTAKSGKPKGEICENNSILIKDVNDEYLSLNEHDTVLFYESEDAFFADECHARGPTMAAKSCKQKGEICENNSIITTSSSTSGESLRGHSYPAAVPTKSESLNAIVQQEIVPDNVWYRDECEARRYYEEDPIMNSVINYLKAPAPPKIYNGSLALGYYTEGSERRHLLSTPTLDKAALILSYQPAEHKVVPSQKKSDLRKPLLSVPPPVPLSHIKIEHAPYDMMLPSSLVNESLRCENPLLIVIDSNIVLQRQLKPDDLQMILRRLMLDKLLTHLPHNVMYHRFLEEYIRDGIKNSATSRKERKCMEEFLMIMDSYGRQNILTQMGLHRCDNTLDQDKIHCLRYTIAAARREDKSVEVRYLTDLARCTMQRCFEDPRVKFVGYESSIRIFD